MSRPPSECVFFCSLPRLTLNDNPHQTKKHKSPTFPWAWGTLCPSLGLQSCMKEGRVVSSSYSGGSSSTYSYYLQLLPAEGLVIIPSLFHV